MTSNTITNQINETSVRKAALIAGFGLVIIVITAIFAEFYVFPKLIVNGDAAETTANIIANKKLFLTGLFSYLIALIGDLVVAWALYVFLKPVNKTVSLLAGWFRLVYTIIALIALLNLLTVWHLVSGAEYLNVFETDHLHAQIMLAIKVFGDEWAFGFVFFGMHLGLLGYLVLKSVYVPKILGILLILAGVGYLIEYNLKPLLFPDYNTGYLMITFFGELAFMVWLLIRGWKIQEQN